MERKLHIGGKVAALGWEVMNAVPAPCVDHVGNANDLTRFPDNTFDAIYASHVVEHFDYNGELTAVLGEWHRVLKTFGRLYVSVPDMDVLARLLLDRDRLNKNDRFFVMRMLFGGHCDPYDYHLTGLNQEILTDFLTTARFCAIKRVQSFNIFDDTSAMTFKGELISLNLIAKKLLDG